MKLTFAGLKQFPNRTKFVVIFKSDDPLETIKFIRNDDSPPIVTGQLEEHTADMELMDKYFSNGFTYLVFGKPHNWRWEAKWFNDLFQPEEFVNLKILKNI